ncbi:MAG: threonine synthase [Clostridiales Family XIII bacterium]|jgi:threonine synthase|nr:threonine synthase [Clostridiales Family XIII bacterium]
MKTNSFISALECPKCGSAHDFRTQAHLCGCGSPLLAVYDLEAAKKTVTKESIARRKADLWRYKELLPVLDEDNIVTLGEGMTPLLPLPRAGKAIGVEGLLIKDEGVIPTGTFKARGAAVGVSKAKELGAAVLAMPTNGNAGAAWAAYAAKAGIAMSIAMPLGAPPICRTECAAYGAELRLVDGLISDCGKLVAEDVSRLGHYDASTLKEPYRIEGKKTMGYEIAEQLGWRLPDVIIYPTGGGVGLIGIHKALAEMRALGLAEGDPPRLVAVQAEGCAPIVRAFEEGREESEFWEGANTVAFGINVPKALGDFLVLRALRETGGAAEAVSDDEILRAMSALAATEGQFVCPEGAAAFAAAGKLREKGWIREGETVALLNTGAGIKYPGVLGG